MTQFVCHGPFPITTTKQKVGRSISKTDISKFWDEAGAMSSRVGAYVFAMRTSRAITPLYVGKATKSFAQELFATDKLNKYATGLQRYARGTPVWFFVCHPPTKRGKPNGTHITALEKLLIQQGALANPDLINVHHKAQPKWGISGALRSVTKKPSNEAREFREVMGFAR